MDLNVELKDQIDSIKDLIATVNRDVAGTSKVTKRIVSNAAKSKMLALNASIEAARTGEAGRGFTVVAQQMGEMSTSSSELSSEISHLLGEIASNMIELDKKIKELSVYTQKEEMD